MTSIVDEEISFRLNDSHEISSIHIPAGQQVTANNAQISSESSNLDFSGFSAPNTSTLGTITGAPSPERSQSQSLFAGLSTPLNFASVGEREEKVKDRFNGILYHVIHSEGTITILFSSKDLYHKFIEQIDKELQARRTNDVQSNYTTHIRGRYCAISSDNNAASITVAGPARTQWRETVFIRLSIRLYQQFVTETAQDVSLNHRSQTSTPAVLTVEPNSPPVSPVYAAEQVINAQHVPSISDISRQLGELQQISNILREQLHNINKKIDTLVQCASIVPKSPEIQNISDTTLGDDPHFITLSATDGEDSQLIPGASTYSEALTGNMVKSVKNVTHEKTLTDKSANHKPKSKTNIAPPTQVSRTKTSVNENRQNQTSSQSQMRANDPNINNRTLLLGDSILAGTNRKGLINGTECHPIPGATIDSIYDKIQIFDVTKFSKIVIYVGGNDASRCTDTNYFEHKYQQLIAHVKILNPTCKIFLCTACPRGDTNVTDINEMIEQLCHRNKLTCVNVYEAFFDKHNKKRDHFYKPRDNIHLSRSGTKRLLGSIDTHVHIVENYNSCVYPVPQNQNSQYRDHGNNGVQNRKDMDYVNQYSHGTYHAKDQHTNRLRPSSNYQQHEEGNQYYHPRSTSYKDRGDSQHVDRPYMDPDTEYRRKERCIKCGFDNHVTDECKHQTQVQCFRCGLYGHKNSSGLCWTR